VDSHLVLVASSRKSKRASEKLAGQVAEGELTKKRKKRSSKAAEAAAKNA